MQINRRNFITSLAGSLAATAVLPRSTMLAEANAAPAIPASSGSTALSDIPLLEDALQALDRHSAHVRRDKIAIADFGINSALPRFHLVDLEKQEASVLQVTHGSGSDPAHTGWLQSFSNRHGSNATCDGSFATANYYHGRHGHSQRLLGLDASNSNAMDRAIVLHSAWYAEPEMVSRIGKLGRSQGCFAFSESKLPIVFDHLGEGRLLYAGTSATA